MQPLTLPPSLWRWWFCNPLAWPNSSQGKWFHLSFHTSLPVLTTVSSQQKCLCACGQAGTWTWSKWKLTQPKPRQNHKVSTQRKQAAWTGRSNHPFLQQHRVMPNESVDKFRLTCLITDTFHIFLKLIFLHDKSFHCLFPFTKSDTGLDVHHGSNFWDTFEKRKGHQLCKKTEMLLVTTSFPNCESTTHLA